MSDQADTITLDQMKAAVGSLLFLWSDIERALRAAFATEPFAGNRKPVHLISQALQVWSERVMPRGGDRPLQRELCQRLHELLKDALLVRNLICHSLIGYSAQPPYQTQEAHLLVAIGEETRALTWNELQAMFRWMARSRWLIDDLTAAAMEKDAAASEAGLRGWVGFPERL
jgi:hypothetical protein